MNIRGEGEEVRGGLKLIIGKAPIFDKAYKYCHEQGSFWRHSNMEKSNQKRYIKFLNVIIFVCALKRKKNISR